MPQGPNAAHSPTRADGCGCAAAVQSWQVQSSAVEANDGSVVSTPAYRADGWYVAPPRSTLMATLLANGQYRDIEYSTRLRDDVDASAFGVPWWYRTTFYVTGDGYTTLRADGIIPKADLFVNGSKVAGRDVIAGAYTTNTFDVTPFVRRGLNSAAFLVYPGNPNTDLSIGWVDWNQWPPDNNMGIWRDVFVVRSGPLRLARPSVRVEVAPDRHAARLVLTVDVANLSGHDAAGLLSFAVSGPSGTVVVNRDVHLARGGETRVRVSAEEESALVIANPAIWWPRGDGDQPLYDLEITAIADTRLSDRATASFGIRSVTSYVASGGGRQFVINGQPVPIRGGGWSPDLFLRHDRRRIANELRYAAEIGLNTIRLEGKGENPEFFDLADETGMLVLPGWECCDKWEAHAGTGGTPWDDADFSVAARSMASEAFRLANHPCVIGFVIGSDFAPEPRAARAYVEALADAAWDLPIVSSATVEGSEEAGPSGMKMTGPYAWVPPVYWYSRDPELGGAIGFNSETSAGNNIPRLASLERMLAAGELDQLWREPASKQFHAGPPSEFDNVAIFWKALAGRYGEPRSLRDFVAKAQLASYEATRAQFEAYGCRTGLPEPATGVVYWMLNSAWPSLNWQLWDHYLDPGGAYFGTKKANEAVHVQYAYDERSVMVVNRTRRQSRPFEVTVGVRDGAGIVVSTDVFNVEPVAAGEVVTIAPVEVPVGVGPMYFLELTTSEGSRNVYWLSTVEDELALDQRSWQYTPAAAFADLRALEELMPPDLAVRAASIRSAGWSTTRVSVTVGVDSPPVVGLHASILASGGVPVSPVIWDDNDLVLFAGQSATIEAGYALAQAEEHAVELDAFNLATPHIV